MIELRKFLSPSQRDKLVGKRIVFTVKRGGELVERSQTITRVNPTTVWCNAFLYDIDELQNVREAE